MMDWLIAALVGVAGFAAIWFGGRKSAQNSIKLKQAETRLEAVKEAEDVRNEVEALDRESLKRRSARWVRGSKR